jgi:integrase
MKVFSADFQNISRKRLKPLAKKAGVPVITFHDLRHTFTSNLATLGVPVIKIKELLGHTDLKTTMRYMHLARDALAGTTEILVGEPCSRNTLRLVR